MSSDNNNLQSNGKASQGFRIFVPNFIDAAAVKSDKTYSPILQFIESVDIGGEHGNPHPAVATAAGQDSRRARTVRDTTVYSMLIKCMPNDLLREECRSAKGNDRSGLQLWEYLNKQYLGANTLSKQYHMDDK